MVREGILMVKERNLMMARHILLAVSLLNQHSTPRSSLKVNKFLAWWLRARGMALQRIRVV